MKSNNNNPEKSIKRKTPKHQGNFNTKSLDYITSSEPLKGKFCDTIMEGLKSFDKLKKMRHLYL